MGIAARLRSASVDRDIAAPAAAVWRLLTGVRAWPDWGPSVRAAVLSGGATQLSAGAQGTVLTAVGVRLPFTITEYEPQRRWAWTVAGVPATGHDLAPTPQGCRVRFEVPWWALGYLPVCTAALGRLEKLARVTDYPG